MSKNVVVTHVESVSNFYVYLEKYFLREECFQEFLKDSVGSVEDKVECKKIYLVQHDDDKWYRVMVLKTIDEKFCEVRVVDYGNILKIEREQLRCCNNQLLRLMKPHAILCSLDFDEDEINIRDEVVKLHFEFLVAHL